MKQTIQKGQRKWVELSRHANIFFLFLFAVFQWAGALIEPVRHLKTVKLDQPEFLPPPSSVPDLFRFSGEEHGNPVGWLFSEFVQSRCGQQPARYPFSGSNSIPFLVLYSWMRFLMSSMHQTATLKKKRKKVKRKISSSAKMQSLPFPSPNPGASFITESPYCWTNKSQSSQHSP